MPKRLAKHEYTDSKVARFCTHSRARVWRDVGGSHTGMPYSKIMTRDLYRQNLAETE